MSTTYCWNCNSEIPENQFHRQDTCSKCRRDTHACKNCIHYDISFNNSCKEAQAERVVDKEKSNFCDYFQPSQKGASQVSASKDALKTAAEALFKKN